MRSPQSTSGGRRYRLSTSLLHVFKPSSPHIPAYPSLTLMPRLSPRLLHSPHPRTFLCLHYWVPPLLPPLAPFCTPNSTLAIPSCICSPIFLSLLFSHPQACQGQSTPSYYPRVPCHFLLSSVAIPRFSVPLPWPRTATPMSHIPLVPPRIRPTKSLIASPW